MFPLRTCAWVLALTAGTIGLIHYNPTNPRSHALQQTHKAEIIKAKSNTSLAENDEKAKSGPDLESRKRRFIKTLLPIAKRENERILRERAVALSHPSPRLYRKYRVVPGQKTALIRRIDAVPISLVLSQAAIETGWGSSRFAHQANSYFGQHTHDPTQPGVRPKNADDVKVRAFENAAKSVRAYLHNLNTHPAYENFRTAREQLRSVDEAVTGWKLAGYLSSYSERGQAYIRTIRSIIEDNNLQRFDNLQFAMQ